MRTMVERLFKHCQGDDLAIDLVEAEGAWSESDSADWDRAREEAWATWRSSRSSTPTS